MDNSLVYQILILALLILGSAYFSATETAFSALNKIRIKNLANDGDKRAKLTLELSENYDKLLSTILIGNNIVNITATSVATVLFVKYMGDVGATVSTAVMTVLVLIFGEISPKSLAKESPESFAMFSAPILRVMLTILAPLNFLFMLWKKLLSKIFKVKEDRGITEEELITIVEEAAQDGGIDVQEGELIRSAIEFDDIEVVDVLTPRIDIEAVPDTADEKEVKEVFKRSGYSRLPVYEGSTDNIIGVINQKDFYNRDDKKSVKSIIKPVIVTTESTKISKLLKLLQKQKSHMAVVTDEYGGTLGIVTMEDIIEELVGEIWDEHDEIINEFEQIEENKYRIVCSANLTKMLKLFDKDEEFDMSTVSGWVIFEFGGIIPNEGDSFDYENLHVIVTKTDKRRVLEVIVEAMPEEESEEE